MDEKRLAFVTGADGLLGSNLVRELLSAGYRVRVLLHPESDSPTLAGLPIQSVRADLLAGRAALTEALAGAHLVCHVAAVTDMRADPDLVWKVNYKGTEALLDACLDARAGRLLFVGSASSFGFGSAAAPGTEECSFPPEYSGVAYMESKHAAAELVRRTVRERGLDAVILAPTFMLGPYDARPSSGELIRQFLVNRLRFVSPGGRNFVHVGDVARAMVAAATCGRAGESYILGGTNLSYRDFFTRVASYAGAGQPIGVLPSFLVRAAGRLGSAAERVTGRPARLNATLARLGCHATYYSPAKAVAELGMSQTPIDAAIDSAIESLVAYDHIAAPGGEVAHA